MTPTPKFYVGRVSSILQKGEEEKDEKREGKTNEKGLSMIIFLHNYENNTKTKKTKRRKKRNKVVEQARKEG